jgi:hypothetical protein
MAETIDISSEMNSTFYKDKDIKVGSVLIFGYEGSKTSLKIIRLNRSKKLCWVEEVKLYSQKEFDELTYPKRKNLVEGGNE